MTPIAFHLSVQSIAFSIIYNTLSLHRIDTRWSKIGQRIGIPKMVAASGYVAADDSWQRDVIRALLFILCLKSDFINSA